MRTFACTLLFLACAVAGYAYGNDPSPRFELLGRERLETPNVGEPANVFVYKDRATGSEILCFAGVTRETLSCFPSGRNRGTN